MATSNVPSPRVPRNNLRKNPNRHRRAYEQAGQLWPSNLRKHLLAAESDVLPNSPAKESLRWNRETA